VASTNSFWSRLGLQAKIFVLCLVLVVGLSGTLLLFSFQRANTLAMSSLQSALSGTRELYKNLEADRIEKLSLINSVIVESPYFKAAVAEMDAATTLDSARDMVEQVGSDFMIVTDFDGDVVARTDLPALTGVDLSADPLVADALAGYEVGGVWRESERLYHAVSVPLLVGPELIGAVVSGYEIGDQLARSIKNFASCEAVFFSSTSDGYVPVGSTLGDNTGTLGSWLSAASMPLDAEDVRVELMGETYQTIFAPLVTADQETVGLFAALRSRDAELAPFRAFQRSVLFAGLIGVLVAGVASNVLARGLVRPIQRLVEVTHKIREGDYRSEVDVSSGDEIGTLARAFRSLLGELREKQMMEKFISRSAADMIQRTDASPKLGSEKRPVTVLFSDLKAHALLKAAASDPATVLDQVNRALGRQADLVERYGGQVDKFIGDRMMAVFKGENRVWPAIRCAISIQHMTELGDQNEVLVPSIGVSAGEAVFGAVGSANRLDYTLLGPAVHVAGRLASDAHPGEVLLSQEAYELVKDRTAAEPLPPLELQGFDEPVGVFSVSTGTARQTQLSQSRAAASKGDVPTIVDGVDTDAAEPELSLSSLEPGSALGKRYEIRRVLGSGGMGMVFQAYDRDLDELVALKVLRPDIATMDPSVLERFKTEIRVARRITHRNIVRTFDFGEVGGIRFITMEFVQGMTLKQLIRARGALPAGVGVQIAKQACAGLVAAHEANVVHRDVKPQNIMLTHQSDVKIMDFGIVREQEKSSITEIGLVMGTPDYMSPEQAQGKGNVDYRSDVYSLGVVLYEMFTGQLPFAGTTPMSVALKHVQEVPREPRAIHSDVPDVLSNVIMRCLEKHPDARYQKMSFLQAELYRITATINAA
jgi:serine/threonine-protein kinase